MIVNTSSSNGGISPIANAAPYAASKLTFEQFSEQMRTADLDLPVQDLDELAQFALQGIRQQGCVLMIGREQMEEQWVDRAKRLANGSCPID